MRADSGSNWLWIVQKGLCSSSSTSMHLCLYILVISLYVTSKKQLHLSFWVFCYVWHYYLWSLMWNAFYSPFFQHDLEVLLAQFPQWLTGPACQEFLYFHRRLVTSQQINAFEAACVCWVIEKYEGHRSIMDLGFNLPPLFALPPRLPRFLSKTYVLFFTSWLLSPQVSLLLLLSLREVWGWEASRNSRAIAMNIPDTFSPHLTLIFLITSHVLTTRCYQNTMSINSLHLG